MKLLLTVPTYPPFNSGLGNAVAQQAAGLAAAGYKVVVATGGPQRSSRWLGDICIETFAVTGSGFLRDPIRGEVSAYTDFLIKNDWDIVLLNAWQNWATDIALGNLELTAGRKFLYSHCISTNNFFLHQPIRSLLRMILWRRYWYRINRLMRKLDGLIFLADGGSDSRFDDLRQAIKCSANFYVIPNALSPSAVKVLFEKKSSFMERNRLIAVGSYQWQKGFDFVLRAYVASAAFNRLPIHFYGQEYTEFSNKLKHQAGLLGISAGYIFFHEGISGDELQAEYELSRLVLSGSHTECQPLALLDASASATPFVARSTGCIDRMPGGIAVKNWSEMAKQIDRLLAPSTDWEMYSQAAIEAAKNVYHPNVVAQKLIAVLEGKA